MGELKFRLPLDVEEKGEDEGKVITNRPYGKMMHPIHKVVKLHAGIDFRTKNPKNPKGVKEVKEVKASERGLVIRAARSPAFGNLIIIDHTPLAGENGRHIYSLYAHLSRMDVERGDFVTKDHPIAQSGNTGTATTGPHLHFAIFDSEKQLKWKAEGNVEIKPHHSKNPSEYFFRTKSVEGTIRDADDLQDQVRDRIQEVMEIVPSLSSGGRGLYFDILVYGKKIGYLDKSSSRIVLNYTIFEAIEILSKPITQRKTEYVVTAK